MSIQMDIFLTWSGKIMDIQKKALEIIYDITGIILKWDKNQLSDKEAMDEIVRALATEKENDIEKVVLLDDVEVNKESIGNKKQKSSSVLVQKRVLAPMIVGVVFIAALFGFTESFTNNADIEIVEENQISFEQLDEIPSNIEEQKSAVEEFGNKTISKQD